MITNERQYRITKAQLDRFAELAEDLRASTPDPSDFKRSLELRAADAQAKELQAQIAEYEGLREGSIPVGRLRSLDELPDVLTRARIASGLTQKALGERLGIQEQQIQRYEANGWSGVGFSRLVEVANVLGIDVDIDPGTEESSRELLQAARQSGLDAGFIERRLSPKARAGAPFLLDLASRMNRVFGWLPSELLSGGKQPLQLSGQLSASYKLPARAREDRVRAYTLYTHYLSLLTLDATRHLEVKPLPQSPTDLRSFVLQEFGRVDFQSVLLSLWDLGIPILPLTEPGGFHAIVWRTDFRNVIVLKQPNRSESRWLFDLLHEFKHVLEEPSSSERVSIEEASEDADLETAANLFAGAVLLDGKAEELAEQCVTEAQGRVEYLQRALPEVARRNGVSAADLANYMAYRLLLQGINWWGTAETLQEHEYDPWDLARDAFLARSELGNLVPIDRELLAQALTE
jgi:Zn-dependent peptidase ImmA (M78 family)/transcriptional regulator with XRE-family HTH domain